jgi:hypothetical protein
MKTIAEFVNESKSSDLKKYGIKELQDGLTIEQIKKDFPWLLKAKIKDAVIGTAQMPRYVALVWYDGTWKGGTWKKGNKWMDGIWEDGTWDGGMWYDGTWKGGTWKDGMWEDGTWRDGTWKDGIWSRGTWEDGTWHGGTWKGGTWKDGMWINGDWQDGIWEDGNWSNGWWISGTWEDGTWHRGTWKGGTWKGGNKLDADSSDGVNLIVDYKNIKIGDTLYENPKSDGNSDTVIGTLLWKGTYAQFRKSKYSHAIAADHEANEPKRLNNKKYDLVVTNDGRYGDIIFNYAYDETGFVVFK